MRRKYILLRPTSPTNSPLRPLSSSSPFNSLRKPPRRFLIFSRNSSLQRKLGPCAHVYADHCDTELAVLEPILRLIRLSANLFPFWQHPTSRVALFQQSRPLTSAPETTSLSTTCAVHAFFGHVHLPRRCRRPLRVATLDASRLSGSAFQPIVNGTSCARHARPFRNIVFGLIGAASCTSRVLYGSAPRAKPRRR